MKPCPTCGASGNETCVRGSMYGGVWKQQIPYPEGHDSRRSINKENE